MENNDLQRKERNKIMETRYPQKTDVVIIGGGLAGLSAASYLARAGLTVTLFEKAAHVGGRAASRNYDGYWFNRGIHAIYTGGATSEVLRELGVAYKYGVPGKTFLLRQGKMGLFPASVPALLGSRLLSLGDKLELARLFSALPRLKAESLAHVSVEEWLEQVARRPRVRQVLASTARVFTYSAALELVSAEVLVSKLQLILKNPVHYVEGGWQTLVDGLRQVAEEAGVHIVSGCRVAAVLYQPGTSPATGNVVKGVRLSDGEVLEASHVLLATGPADAVKLVDGGNYAPLRALVEPLVPARIACLDVALKRLPDARYPVVQDLEQPRFLSAQSFYTRVAPEGGAMISVFKQLHPQHASEPREDERELEALLDEVQPGWREVLVRRVFLPHIEAIGMLPLASSGGYAGRPGPLVPGIANLYLAGDWIGAGFLSDPSMGSARQVAQLILQKREAASL
jgi:phytoene dehydrogenase-like protein